jgi:tartrate-resistant acid phosphatase type 5
MLITTTRLFHVGVMCLLLACTASYGQGNEKQLTIDGNFKPHPDALNFYLFGDFGRDGKAGQKKVSEVMTAAAKIEPPEFIISTGDNFYPDGVQTTTDKQWKTSFEDIYTGKDLHCPWYVVLGNHDYHSNPQAEIDYTKVSKRWNMPARYYVKSFPVGKGSTAYADFIFVDTSPLQDEYYGEKHRSNIITQDTTRQLKWIDSVLTVSKATWKIVVGHHAMYTGGKRIDDVPFVRKHLEKIFIKNNVDAYLCGHEHDLQFIKPDGKTTYLVSGAGSEVRPTGKLPYTKFAAATNGFMALAITTDAIYVDVMDAGGKLIYSSTIEKDNKD